MYIYRIFVLLLIFLKSNSLLSDNFQFSHFSLVSFTILSYL